jgi:hypothetical protein
MTLSVIDLMNLRYRDVIAAKKGTYEPVPNNLVTVNWIAHEEDPSELATEGKPRSPNRWN